MLKISVDPISKKLRIKVSKEGGNPYHDEAGRFTEGGGGGSSNVPSHDVFTVERNPDMPKVWGEMKSVDTPREVKGIERSYVKQMDQGVKVGITEGALSFLSDSRIEELKANLPSRSTTDARADQIFRLRDSSGRATPRKWD